MQNCGASNRHICNHDCGGLATKDGIVRHSSVGAAEDHRVIRNGNDSNLTLCYLIDHSKLGELMRGQIERNDGPITGSDNRVVCC